MTVGARTIEAQPSSDTTVSQKSADNNPGGVFHFAEVFGEAAVRSGILEPLKGVSQLVNAGTNSFGIGKILPEIKVDQPEQVKFGSSDWFAQTIGSGVGMIVPFMAADFGVGKIVGADKIAALEAQGGMAAKIAPLVRPTLSGAAYGLIFTPTDEHGNFFEQRGINAAVGGITFGAQRAATLGLMKGLASSGVPLAETAFQNSVTGHLTRIGANMVGGSFAGVANAESQSLLSGNGFASKDQLAQSVAAFTVTGGALDLAHIGGGWAKGKLAGDRASISQPVADGTTKIESPTEPPKAGGGSGKMMDVQERMVGGNTDAKASSEIVVKTAANLTASINQHIDSVFPNEADATAQKQQFRKLVDDVAAREHIDEVGTDARHLAQTYDAINRLLQSNNLDERTRLGLAKQILYETVNINDINSGANATAEAKGTQLVLADRVPGKMANGIVDLATTGQHTTNRVTPILVDLSPAALAKLPAEYQNALHPDAEARQTLNHVLSADGATPLEGKRTYASQLAQTLINNIKTQGSDDQAIYVKGPVDPAIHGDTGERLFTADHSGQFKAVHEDGVPKIGAGLKTPDIQPILDHVSGVDNDSLVIKNGNTFMIMNPEGRIAPGDNVSRFGIYANDQRFLNNLDVAVNGAQPEFLSGTVQKGYAGKFEYSNVAADTLPADTVHLTRDVVVNDGKVTEQLALKNTTDKPQTVHLTVGYGSDYADMFEVRGWMRENRGTMNEPIVSPENSRVLLSYKGLDGATTHTDISVAGKGSPTEITKDGVHFTITLPPQAEHSVELSVKPGVGEQPAVEQHRPFTTEISKADQAYEEWRQSGAVVTTDNPAFNKVMDQAMRDLYMLRINTPEGDGIAAGIPWYVAAFGRDQLITSMQTLPYHPELAKGVLEQLAAYQGKEVNATTAEKPGKIMHELRLGEMGRNKEIPFTPYYGTVDATPLWLMLLGRYVDQTGDVELSRKLQPNVDRALEYLANETKTNGYLNYGGNGAEALSNQGWKDSGNSVSNKEGQGVKPPIALAEPQGYLYAAWRQAAKLFNLQGDVDRANRLNVQAENLKARFNKDFWMPEEGFAAMAINGEGQQASAIASNPGHLLSTGLLTADHALAVVDRLMKPDMNSGYGIRTLSSDAVRYNPASYHNGTVWPHDNGMIVEGIHDLTPYSGYSESLLSDFLKAAQKFPESRLPELYSGFPSADHVEPIIYPEQSSPQAWAAGAVPQMLSSSLAIHPDAVHNILHIFKPSLPAELSNVDIKGYRVGNSTVDLRFSRANGATNMQVLSNPNNVNIDYLPNTAQLLSLRPTDLPKLPNS